MDNPLIDMSGLPPFGRNILEKGGSREAIDLYADFRGREPTIDALLRHSGIAA